MDTIKPENSSGSAPATDELAWRELKAILRYIEPYWRHYILGLAALFIGIGSSLLIPLFAGCIIDTALHGGTGTVPILGGFTLNGVGVLLIATILAQTIGEAAVSVIFGHIGQAALADLRKDTYGKLIGLPLAFFSERRVGELISRIYGDISQLESALIFAVPQLCRHLLVLSGGVALLAVTSPKLTLPMLCTMPLLVTGTVVFGRKLRSLARDSQDRLAVANTIMEETLHGITGVKAFANEDFELDRYHQANVGLRKTSTVAVRWRAAFGAVFTLSIYTGIIIVLWFGAHLIADGQISPGELTRFAFYSMFLAGAMSQLADLYNQVQRAIGASQRVREILRAPVEISLADAGNFPKSAPVTPRLRGEVELRGVTFSYPSRPNVMVLSDISMKARPGDVTALVGPSGAGKSTLISLLFAFHAPERGKILIDGRELWDFDLRELRRDMALVPQDIFLFGGSIADNIRYGKPNATADEIFTAAAKANATEFIDRFPNGYATVIGDRGIKLSGGQRQRIAIARAILRDPRILVLDEATSSLDSESENLVQDALARLMTNRTTFVIAHRLTTVRRATQILVLDRGKIIERGTHDELSIKPESLYSHLCSLQFRNRQ